MTRQQVEWFVPAVLESVDRERNRVLTHLNEWGVQVDPRTSDTISLLVAELVRDAVRYNRTAQISLTMKVTGRDLLFEAVSHDSSPSLAGPRPEGPQQDGRDRTLLKLLAKDFGSCPTTSGGMGAWFTLALPEPSSAQPRRTLMGLVRQARPRQAVHRLSGRSDTAA